MREMVGRETQHMITHSTCSRRVEENKEPLFFHHPKLALLDSPKRASAIEGRITTDQFLKLLP